MRSQHSPHTREGMRNGPASPEEQGVEPGEKVLLLRRADWLRGQRGLRELTVTTFPGGVTDCSSWAGLTEAVEPALPSGAWDRNGPRQKWNIVNDGSGRLRAGGMRSSNRLRGHNPRTGFMSEP